MPDDLVLANARLVLPGEVVRGRLRVEAGRIAAIDDGAGVPPGAVDFNRIPGRRLSSIQRVPREPSCALTDTVMQSGREGEEEIV